MVISIFVFAASLWLQGAPPPPPAPLTSTDALGQAYFLFLQGRMLESRDDTVGAMAAYRKAAELWPNAAQIRAELANLLAREDKTDEAVTEAMAALAIDPDNRDAHRTLGFLRGEQADAAADPAHAAPLLSDAIAHLEIAMRDQVVDPNTELTLGRLYVRTGQFSKGIETLRTFLLDQPAYADAMLLLADAYVGNHQQAEAIAILQELVADQPDQLRAWVSLAELNEEGREWKAAAAAWGHLADLSPRNLAYRARQATALVNSGDVTGGRQALVQITQVAPGEVSAWYLLSQVDRRAGNTAGAEESARHIIDMAPGDSRGPIALAEAETAHGDYRAAVDILDPLVTSPRPEDVASGSFAAMAGTLATALEAVGERTRAVTMLEEARRRDADDVDLAFDLASAYEHDDKFDEAEQTFRAMIAADPVNAEALNDLGYMLADHGKKLDEAVGLIKRALVIDADNASFLDSLGWAYVKQARLDQARDPLQRAAEARPKTSVIQEHLAELYFQLKLYREAANAWDRALSGDLAGIDAASVTKNRDRARQLAK